MKPLAIALPTVLCAFAAATSTAQQVALSLSTPTGLIAIAAPGGVPLIQTLPSGAMPLSGGFHAVAPTQDTSASTTWVVHHSPGLCECEIAQWLRIGASAPAASFCAIGQQDIVLHVAASSNTPAMLRVALGQSYSLGVPLGLLEVDIGNDGSVELTQSALGVLLQPVQLGPQPLAIRIRTALLVAGTGQIWSNLNIGVLPDNDLVIDQMIAQCENSSGLVVTPTFVGTGIELWCTGATLNRPFVQVLGLTTQPLVLPPVLGSTAPCVWLPSPELLVLRTSQAPSDLALPAAVRPVTIWAQAIGLTPNGLTTTQGYRITAN